MVHVKIQRFFAHFSAYKRTPKDTYSLDLVDCGWLIWFGWGATSHRSVARPARRLLFMLGVWLVSTVQVIESKEMHSFGSNILYSAWSIYKTWRWLCSS